MNLFDRLSHAALRRAGFESRWVPTSLGKVHLMEGRGEGQGPPLVLVHGLSSQGAHFSRLVRHLRAQTSRFVLLDMPSHGLSDVALGMVGHELKDAMHQAFDTIDGPFSLYGNSLGGYGCITYASENPERVRALAVSSPGGGPLPDDDAFRSWLDPFRVRTYSDALALVDRVFARRPFFRPLVAWFVRQQVGNGPVQDFVERISPSDYLRPDQLASLTMPVLFIWGRQERIMWEPQRDFFFRHLPAHARVLEPEGFGHSPHTESPRALAHTLREFLAAS